MMKKIFATLLFAAAPSLFGTELYTRYIVTPFDIPGAFQTFPLGLNSSRAISGYYVDLNFVPHGFEYYSGNLVPLSVPFAGAIATGPGTINDQGTLVGTWIDSNGIQHGFTRTLANGCVSGAQASCSNGTFTSFDVPGSIADPVTPYEFGPGLQTAGIGVNNLGVISGLYATESGLDKYSNGYIKNGNTYITVDHPNAGHTAPFGTKLFGINDLGVAAGTYTVAPGISVGFTSDGTSFTTVFVPGSELGGFGTQVNGINNDGTVTGTYTDPSGLGHGLIVKNGVYNSFTIPGSPFSEIHTINAQGDFVGSYFDANFGAHGFIASPVPEPSTVGLSAAGLLALLIFRRRRS